MSKLASLNPATGELLREIDTTPTDALPEYFRKAREAQMRWSALPIRKRAAALTSLREVMLDQIDQIAELISLENGKPRFEALANELLPAIELLTYFARISPHALQDEPIPMGLMKHRQSELTYWPLGTVAVISPWNYPFLLPFGEIVMAITTGNAVIFKPSEITWQIGLKIQELFELAGYPTDLLQTIFGDGSLGSALIEQKPAKIFFTGSVATGKKIMAAAALHLIPVNLELGGKDAMIVLGDADLDYATSAALWGGFSNSGQVCASVERIIVHESIVQDFTRLLLEKVTKLRQGNSADQQNDLGVITLDRQKQIYEAQLTQAKAQGAEILCGGIFSDDRRSLQPTIITGPKIEELDVYNEETFGPVVAITTFRSVQQAIEKANQSKYGLLASVITKNLSLAHYIAKQLEVGTVTINEVVYTAGLPETPWGGVKNSGFGKKHSARGLQEFVNVRHIHRPRSMLFVFKSPWWFPYTEFQYATFRKLFDLYRRSLTARIKAFPLLIWNFVQFIKKEKRL
ncbi:MAG: aldehyde dehydrogenase family protein [Methylotenera sp.]|nr:aldehyde dehydrogenase family protein [Oligoflexia bacterium]